MSIRNHVSLIGNVGNDPEYKSTETGTEIAKFSIGTHETYKDASGNRITTTDWHNLVAFGKLAGLIRDNVKKGAQLGIHGRIKSRSYENDKGEKKYITEIIIEELQFLDKKS